jgi:hypothetical protein
MVCYLTIPSSTRRATFGPSTEVGDPRSDREEEFLDGKVRELLDGGPGNYLTEKRENEGIT